MRDDAAPDWTRLGVRFAVPDVCVAFRRRVTVYEVAHGFTVPLAEDVVALRDGPEGVSLQTASGLFLFIEDGRLGDVRADLDAAYVLTGTSNSSSRARTRRSTSSRTSRENPSG